MATKRTAQAKATAAPSLALTNCSSIAEAAKMLPEQVGALAELARASTAHVKAIEAIAAALKGSGGTINGNGIQVAGCHFNRQE